MATKVLPTVAVKANINISFQEGKEIDAKDETFVPPPTSWFENHPSSPPESILMGTNQIDQDDSEDEDEDEDDQTEGELKRHAATNAKSVSSSSSVEVGLHAVGVPILPSHYAPPVPVGNTHPSPGWKEISSQVLPAAARELFSSSWRRIYYTARLSYAKGRWQRKYSDLGNNTGGIFLGSSQSPSTLVDMELPPFSSLNWIDRQLVQEWRTYLPHDDLNGFEEDPDEDFDFERARALVPNPFPCPKWQKTDVCHQCQKTFGPTRLRHHCRMCGYSFCQSHSSSSHRLPHLGYDPEVPERVCDQCKRTLQDQNLAERVAWRLARCRDYSEGSLTPYFEMGLDTASEVALRITKAALAMAKSIPLGAQATVAVETVDVLRKYGLQGIYGIMLRQEFLAAADLLQRALNINKTSWPLSVHELSAAIFYALAQHRAMRGLNPDREEIIHTLRSPVQRNQQQRYFQGSAPTWTDTTIGEGDSRSKVRTTVPAVIDNLATSALSFHSNPVVDETDTYHPEEHLNETLQSPMCDPRQKETPSSDHSNFTPVCDPVPDSILSSLIFYAPIALNFVYATKEVDMQLLAAQQGWRLLYAFLEQDTNPGKLLDRPASAVFLHQEYKIVCLAIRGTATINDVVTDIRQIPATFPDQDPDQDNGENEEDWTAVFRGQGLALSGMAAAAVNLFREHIDSIVYFVRMGYRIRITGHSLGGGVATMVGMLVLQHLERQKDLAKGLQLGTQGSLEEGSLLRVYAYGTPSCVDGELAEAVDSFVTTVVLHDDVFPRLTPTSCRGLLKHLLHIRETWVKTHIREDLRAVGERARTVWAPRFRQSYTLTNSSSSLKKYCKKQLKKGKDKLLSVTEIIGGQETKDEGDHLEDRNAFGDAESLESDPSEWGERFFIPTCASITQSLDTTMEDYEEAEDDQNDGGKEPQLLLEFLGGADNQTEGIVVDGEEFFDSEDKLIESDDEETVATECFREAMTALEEPLSVNDSWSIETEPKLVSPCQQEAKASSDNEDAEPTAVVLEETPLPRMFVPGKVIHVYSHRGVYKAAHVPRTFRELRRISLAGNMLSNHTAKSYYEGLLEVQTARIAPEKPPRWTAFDEDDTCCCCANRFTWASTSNSEAQEARDKHNCRSCGGLVCDPCAKNRVPIPSIGLTVPVRVCDRCYNDMGGLSVASSSMTSSFLAVEDEHHSSDDISIPGTLDSSADVDMNTDERPERKREKRSFVVDELAMRMKLSTAAPYT